LVGLCEAEEAEAFRDEAARRVGVERREWRNEQTDKMLAETLGEPAPPADERAELDGMAAYQHAIANPSKDDPNWPLPSFDARDWAESFCAKFPGHDEETMIGWFANALMRGYDEAGKRDGARIAELERELDAQKERKRLCAIASLQWENRSNLKEADFMRLKVEAEDLAREAVEAEARAEAAEAREKGLREALEMALEYWAHRQQRYKNRHPVWVQKARAALAQKEPSNG
jgi:hypothetical protein